MRYALPALPRLPALRPVLNLIQDLFQGRLLFPTLALGGLLLLAGCATDGPKRHKELGNSFWSQHKMKEAEAEYRQAIFSMPDYAQAHHNLGLALEAQGKYEEAEKEYRRAIRLKPDYANAYKTLGSFLMTKVRFVEAEKELRQAIRWNGKDSLSLCWLANTLDTLDRRNEARVYWEKALKIFQNPVTLKYIKKRLAEPD